LRDDVTDDEVVDLIAGPIFYRRLVAHDRLDRRSAQRLARLVTETVSVSRQTATSRGRRPKALPA
jgi:hypothetical protein